MRKQGICTWQCRTFFLFITLHATHSAIIAVEVKVSADHVLENALWQKLQ